MDKRNFSLMIKTFSETYEKTLNPYVIGIYFDLFKDIPDSQAKMITRKCLRKCKYFPRPADVFEQLEETPERYIYKPEQGLTAEQVEVNIAKNKEILDKLKGKFDIQGD